MVPWTQREDTKGERDLNILLYVDDDAEIYLDADTVLGICMCEWFVGWRRHAQTTLCCDVHPPGHAADPQTMEDERCVM